MRAPEYYAAVFGILRNAEGKILLQRRENTGFNDGILQFPSGHVEGEETYFEAFQREMQEEIGIHFEPDDVKLVYVLHRIHKNDRVYFDIFFEIQNYTGIPKNLEPEKCSELDFFEITHPDLTDFNAFVLKEIEAWNSLWELIM